MASADKQLEQRMANLEKQLAAIAAATRGVGALEADHERRARNRTTRLETLRQPRAVAGPQSRVLHISPRLTHLDDLAVRALAEVKRHASIAKAGEKALKFITGHGLGTAITRLSAGLNNGGSLDETNRLLLTSQDIYGSLVLGLLAPLSGDRPKLDRFVADKDGFRLELLAALEKDGGPRHLFTSTLASEALKRSGATLDETTLVGRQLVGELRAHPVPLSAGRVERAVETAYEKLLAEGVFPSLVDAYVSTREVEGSRFTPEIRAAMVRHLIARGVTIDLSDAEQEARFAEGGYDEYFALAYDQAASSAAGDDDPLVAANTKGASVAPWDFTVDTFDSIEEQGVVKDNILAAGALDYVYELGERLGIFRLVDALTLNWAAGAIDVVDGPCAAKLYRYWKLRDQRADPSERGLVYKRVLNKGETEALDRMVVNEQFELLWGTMAEKVADYRAKVEDAKAEASENLLVSRMPIYQAVRDLQYNLTEFCTGMAHMQVREMYAQLREAMDLLGDPEIIDHFAGGRRKTMWTAIERLSKSEYGEAPNINAIRIAAVEGNAVFRFIANFQQGAVAEDEFQRFIEAAEAWIIAKGSDDSGLASMADEEPVDEDEDAFDEDEDI